MAVEPVGKVQEISDRANLSLCGYEYPTFRRWTLADM
jgi:hypothetical protein